MTKFKLGDRVTFLGEPYIVTDIFFRDVRILSDDLSSTLLVGKDSVFHA